MKTPTMYQHLNAGHTLNGNPKRVFVLYSADGDIVKTIDEGYAGTPKECRGLVQLPSFQIKGIEYRTLLKEYK